MQNQLASRCLLDILQQPEHSARSRSDTSVIT